MRRSRRSLLLSGAALAQDKTFNIWWFEDADSAQGITWTKALEEFKANHPDVTVNFEQKTFDQLQQSGSMILNSDEAPDVLEYNKGNATAGLVASQGLLTNLDDVVTGEGWDKILNDGQLVLSRYDDQGIYGSGPIWGISTYGEYVSVLLQHRHVREGRRRRCRPRSKSWTAAMDAFKAAGRHAARAGRPSTSGQHLLASLAYTKADDTWVQNYQGLKAPLDGAPYLYAAQTLLDWVGKGYITKDSTGMKDRRCVPAVHLGQVADVRVGHLEPRQLLGQHQGLQVGPVRYPDAEVSRSARPATSGSSRRAPRTRTSPTSSSASRCRRSTRPSSANSGGVPIAADPAASPIRSARTLSACSTQIAAKQRPRLLSRLAGAGLL